MVQKYYNMAETAQVLGKTIEDVRQMMDRRELHGYRDGADWKFKTEDIDQLAKQAPPPADDEIGDVLLSEVELGQSDPGLSGTVIGISNVGPIAIESDIRLIDSDLQLADSEVQLGKSDPHMPPPSSTGASNALLAESDLQLADSDIALGALEESKPPAPKLKPSTGDTKMSETKASKFEELNLTLDEDLSLGESSVALDRKPTPGASGGSSVVDLGSKNLEDDDLVLGGGSGAGSGVGSDVTIGGDSGISLVDPSDSGLSLETPINLGSIADESLELGEDDMLTSTETVGGSTPGPFKADDDFMLTPMEDAGDTDLSESGSQVIALDTEGDEASTMIGTAAGISMAGMLDEGLGQPSLDMGMGATPLAPAPILGAQPLGMSEGVPMAAVSMGEAPYTKWQIVGLSVCLLLLMFCGMMTYDLVLNMWSWQEAYNVNSGIMDTLAGWFGW